MQTPKLCDCGQPARYFPLIALALVPMCADCYSNEFPERAGTFDLARVAPDAGEFRDQWAVYTYDGRGVRRDYTEHYATDTEAAKAAHSHYVAGHNGGYLHFVQKVR